VQSGQLHGHATLDRRERSLLRIMLRDTEMEDHETRRKIIRQWRSLPKDKRQTAEQAASFAKKAVEENELQRSRRDAYQRVMGWLLPRIGR
jgi:hypothetical protein